MNVFKKVMTSRHPSRGMIAAADLQYESELKYKAHIFNYLA